MCDINKMVFFCHQRIWETYNPRGLSATISTLHLPLLPLLPPPRSLQSWPTTTRPTTVTRTFRLSPDVSAPPSGLAISVCTPREPTGCEQGHGCSATTYVPRRNRTFRCIGKILVPRPAAGFQIIRKWRWMGSEEVLIQSGYFYKKHHRWIG